MGLYERADFEQFIANDHRLRGESAAEVLEFANSVMGPEWDQRMKPNDLSEQFISYGHDWRKSIPLLRDMMAQLFGTKEEFQERVVDEESATAEGLSIVPTRELYDLAVQFMKDENSDPESKERGYNRQIPSYEDWCEDIREWQNAKPERVASFNYMWRTGYFQWKKEFHEGVQRMLDEQMPAMDRIFNLKKKLND